MSQAVSSQTLYLTMANYLADEDDTDIHYELVDGDIVSA